MLLTKNLKLITALAIGAIATMPLRAERRVEVEPPFGEQRTATVGSSITSRWSHDVTKVYVTTERASQRLLWAKLTIKPGDQLYPVDSSARLKACRDDGSACGLDDDGDGKFDRISTAASTAVKLDQPVRYEMREITNGDADQLKQFITYMGATSDTLRLSYREFVNDMARPAFTEELVLPLGKSFPQTIAIKDMKMTVLGIDGLGLRYRLDR